MKVGPKNERKKEREKREGKHLSSFWTMKLQTFKLFALSYACAYLNK
jgi:hypothetical protein